MDARDCDCCSGTGAETPAPRYNRPGLSAIAYRAASYGGFRRSLLARLSSGDFPVLSALTTRREDDWTIGLCDAFATLGDVLTFYQERIANEAFLRTAAERRSVLELARLVGYRLAPGVAASTSLAFVLDAPLVQPAPPPLPVTVPVGTRVQSVPGAYELPQTFETTEAIVARAEWNAMPAQSAVRELPYQGQISLWLEGTATGLNAGDVVLLVGAAREADPASVAWQLRWIEQVEADPSLARTRVAWNEPLAGFAAQGAVSEDGVRVFALRQRAALFGHNAPDPNLVIPATLPAAQKDALVSDSAGVLSWLGYALDVAGSRLELDAVYPRIVPGGWLALADAEGTQVYRIESVDQASKAAYGMSGKFTRVTLDTSTALSGFGRAGSTVYAQSDELALADKPLRHPVCGSTLALATVQRALAPDQRIAVLGQRLRVTAPQDPAGITFSQDPGRVALPGEEFVVAAAPLQVEAGEAFPLDPALLEEDSGFTGLVRWTLLDRDGATAVVEAQAHALRLRPARQDDPVVQELARVDAGADAIAHGRDRTTLRLARALAHVYDRATVRVNANVAAATHGETVGENGGGGDASIGNQRFVLRQSPLTYVAASNGDGRASTLSVRVNDLAWTEAPTLYAQPPGARVYVLRQEDDGATVVQFGDGREGARLPSGSDNVRFAYRKGLGIAGNVRAGTLSTLLARPLGVKAATNPEEARGGQEPESLADARRNAPHTVLTMDRTVSILDHEDFARRFAGIAKAVAVWVEAGRARGIHITVAGVGGAPVTPGDATYGALYDALRSHGDPLLPLRVYSFAKVPFSLKARIRVHPSYEAGQVLSGADTALRAAYSFDARDFQQPVTLDEIMAVLHRVAGVAAVDIDRLHRNDEAPATEPMPRIFPQPSRLQADGTVNAAELLILDDGGVELEPMP